MMFGGTPGVISIDKHVMITTILSILEADSNTKRTRKAQVVLGELNPGVVHCTLVNRSIRKRQKI